MFSIVGKISEKVTAANDTALSQAENTDMESDPERNVLQQKTKKEVNFEKNVAEVDAELEDRLEESTDTMCGDESESKAEMSTFDTDSGLEGDGSNVEGEDGKNVQNMSIEEMEGDLIDEEFDSSDDENNEVSKIEL